MGEGLRVMRFVLTPSPRGLNRGAIATRRDTKHAAGVNASDSGLRVLPGLAVCGLHGRISWVVSGLGSY